VQGVALADHPDGINSVLAALRDVSAPRHLETTLRELEQTLPEHEAGSRLAGELRAQLEGALAERTAERTDTARAMDALRAQLEQSITDRQRLETAADRAKADRQRLEAAIEQGDADRRQLQSTLDEALAERQEFESAVKQRAANRQRLLAEHAAARVRAESALVEAASHDERLTQLLADQGLDLQRTEENARRLESLATAGQLALEASLAERTEAAQAMDTLRAQLEQSRSDRLGLETTAGQDRADRQRLESAIEQRDADRRQLQSTLDESLAERQAFESAVKQRAANRQRLLSEHATARLRVESALAEAASRNEQLTKLLADQSLDLQRTEENARRLESLAAAGRLALEVARELQTIVGALDARTKDLLAKCPLEADEREEMEIFRSAAIRASSLARQIVQAERIA
jgi:chromosome segregation ATPase